MDQPTENRPQRKIATIVAAVVVVLAAVGYGSFEGYHQLKGAKNDVPAEQIPENTVLIQDFAYEPKTIKVKVGTTVTWQNRDATKHTVTSEEANGPLQSPRFGQDESFTYTFMTPGTFPYYCEPHPYMKGSVEVTP